MESNSNTSAILNVVAINKELPSLKDALEVDPHYDSLIVSYYIFC